MSSQSKKYFQLKKPQRWRVWQVAMTRIHPMRGKILESQKAPLSTFEPKKKKRNPPWTRDELVLALDLYLRHRLSSPQDPHQEVAELSTFLGRMGKLLGIASQETFRNENGVTMTMSNLSRLYPAYTADGRVGLQDETQVAAAQRLPRTPSTSAMT